MTVGCIPSNPIKNKHLYKKKEKKKRIEIRKEKEKKITENLIK